MLAARREAALVCGTADTLPFRDEVFDVVLAADVLEHLTDDELATSELFRVLRPGGTLVVNVPTDPGLWSEHDVALGHVRRYTRSRLNELLSSAGFRVGRMDSWMVLTRPLVRLSRRARSLPCRRSLAKPAEATAGASLEATPAQSDCRHVNRATNFILLGALLLEERIPQLRSRDGVSSLAVAKKPPAPFDGADAATPCAPSWVT
jgi:SAM-dependent methyltransferase